ncbi:hypothetical protein [Helicobacter sp. 23-1045]
MNLLSAIDEEGRFCKSQNLKNKTPISSLRVSEANTANYKSKNGLLRCFRYAQTASQ